MNWVQRAGAVLTIMLPLPLLHARGVAEAVIALLGVLFLIQSAVSRDWAWLRAFWVRIGLAWWAWLVFCTVLAGAGQALQAVALIRFIVLVAALESWTLRDPAVRDWLARLCRWAAVYIGLQSLLQFATGRNAFGYPRSGDGELTGPYAHPRAAAPLSRLLFPALLPPLARWMAWQPVAAALLGVISVGTMVLIGQRMPLLLTGLGLFVTALLLPRLRAALLTALVLAGVLLAVTPVVSPPTYTRLVTKFTRQMEGFPDSHYGAIAARAVSMARQHPLTGLGFDGFRLRCEEPRYFQGWRGDEGGGAAICVQHPHSHYLQAIVEAGWPGLLLFTALVVAWLARLASGLWRDPSPLRTGLFVAALIHEFPIASASAFSSMPLSGWFFLLLGLGLAETRAYMQSRTV